MNENLNENEVTKEENAISTIQDFGALSKQSDTKQSVFSNITDAKKIFNLESKVDNLLNDCVDEVIRVKEVLIKKFEKPLPAEEIVYDEETGEIIKDKKTSYSCILIDDRNVSYATGSKIFTIQLMRYLQMFGINKDGFEIKIVKNKVANSSNKSLGFELV